MISDDDRSLLTAALESALQAHQKQEPRPSLLSDPDQSSSTPLATPLPSVQRSSKWLDTCFTAAALGTRDRCALVCNASFSQSRTEGRQRNSRSGRLVAAITSYSHNNWTFKVAIWGASIDREIVLHDGSSRIMPFEALRETFMKRRILERARTCYDNSASLAHNYFDAPRLAFVREVPNSPYIGTDVAPFRTINELQFEARDLWLFIEAVSVGHPLAIGCWFEYADQDLDVNQWVHSLGYFLKFRHVSPATRQ